MTKITNTEKNPHLALLSIEMQEAVGQHEFVNSLQLPAKANSPTNVDIKAQYALMGITVIAPSKGDTLFLDVRLPLNWQIRATDHSMWNELVDHNHAVRATMFYKAAFYDRDAFINFQTRYQPAYRSNETERWYEVIDTAENKTLFTGDRIRKIDYDLSDTITLSCKQFLNQTYPDWRDINAYWVN